MTKMDENELSDWANPSLTSAPSAGTDNPLEGRKKANSITVDGIYEHYKGLRYKILGVARHSETLEELVVYQALYGESNIWVRPLAMFLENVVINGQSQPRFKLTQPIN